MQLYQKYIGRLRDDFNFAFDCLDVLAAETPADILEKIAKYKVTTFCAPPTMYRFLIKEDLKKYDFSALKHCTTAGEALNPEVYKAWLEPRLGSMGLPAPGYRMIIADKNGQEVDPAACSWAIIAMMS